MTNIANEIKKNCEDDPKMGNFLLDLLDFQKTGSKWYKDEYKKIIQKYIEEEVNDEN